MTPSLTATKALLAVLRLGQEHPTLCLPTGMQVARALLAHGLFPAAQAEALSWWAHLQGVAQSSWVPPVPFGARMLVDDGCVEFLRVAREGAGVLPRAPQHVRYRRWHYVDGNAQLDATTVVPPELDDLEHAWDRLLPRWAWTTIPLVGSCPENSGVEGACSDG